VTYQWIPRGQNKHADRLANEALDAVAGGEVWQSKTPLPAASTPPGQAGAQLDLTAELDADPASTSDSAATPAPAPAARGRRTGAARPGCSCCATA
jgi:hypothetical protein